MTGTGKKHGPGGRWRLPKTVVRVAGAALAALLALVWALSLLGPSAHAAPVTITPAGAFTDTNGNYIQAHGGGMIKVGSTYYWLGEDKTGENSNDTSFQHVPCYASTDLAHWTFVNYVLSRQASGDLGPHRIVERPKVIYNSTTQQYVMYMHIDDPNYSTNNVGVATSSSVCGNYTYRGSFRPLGHQSKDMGLFQDDDGTAYLMHEDPASGLRIDKLSADYLSVVSAVAVLNPDHEAPAMFKYNGRYYLLGSSLTWWFTNDNQYTTATSLAGPWSNWSYFAPSGTNTFNSQTTFVLPVTGSAGTTFMFMGDRWTTGNLGTSPYIWLPLQVNDTSVTMAWHDHWHIDTATGLWGDGNAPPTTPTLTPGVTPTPGMTPTPGTTPTVGITPPATRTPMPPTPTPTTGNCKVSYVANSWPGGFTANLTITNTGTSTINGWTLQFSFPGSQQVTQGWNGVYSQSGNQVTITNASYNGTIAPNSSVNPGFNGSWSGSNPSPTAFTLNGAPCSTS